MGILQRARRRARLAWRTLTKGIDPTDSALAQLYPEIARFQGVTTWTMKDGDIPADQSTRFSGYYNVQVWVRKAIDTLASNLAALPVRVTDADNHPLDVHPVTSLLAYVNDQMAPADLWRQWAVDMMSEGEEGWELVSDRVGRYVEIWPRQGATITVVPDRERIDYYGVAEYKVQSPVDSRRIARLPADDFVFYKFYNPLNVWRGLSPLSAVRLGIDLDLAAQAWSAKAFKRGGHWDFALKVPNGTTASERARVEATFRARYMGRENAPFPVLEAGMEDIVPLNWLPKDMEWASQRQFSRQEIGSIFGVPNEIMGFGKDTYENFDAAHKVLWQLMLVPLAGFRDSVLTEHFRGVGLLSVRERVATDFSDVMVLREDVTEALAGAALLIDRGVPFNVVNERLSLGFPELPGGNVGYIPAGMQPIMTAPGSVMPELPTEDEPEPESPDEPNPATDGDGDAPEVERNHAPACDCACVEIKAIELPNGAVSQLPVFESAEHAAYLQKQFDRITSIIDDMKQQLLRDFQRQQIEIAQRLRNQDKLGLALAARLGRGTRRAWTTLQPDDEKRAVTTAGIKAATQAVFSLVEEMQRFEEQYEQYFVITFEEVGQEELEQILSDLDFDMESDDVQMAIAAHLKAFALKTNTTTWTDLISLFQQAEAEGLGIPEIVERLNIYYEGRKADWQLDRIARTTLGGSQNAATKEAYRQTDGLVVGSQWVSALKPATRPAHRAAHGQFRALGESFLVGNEPLAYPGDPDGSAGNIIHCLCAIIAVLRGEEPQPLPGQE